MLRRRERIWTPLSVRRPGTFWRTLKVVGRNRLWSQVLRVLTSQCAHLRALIDTVSMPLLTSTHLKIVRYGGRRRSRSRAAIHALRGGTYLMVNGARLTVSDDQDVCTGVAKVDGPVTQVATSRLVGSYSPRCGGEDGEHVQLLAESGAPLPPIIVHRDTMRVVDGMHRLRAARLRGQHEVDVVYFDGGEDDAFVHAVLTNISHGLPLGLKDRRSAAERILSSHPSWSDRRIATVAGLAPSTVCAIRERSTGRIDQSNARVGRDGKTRRLSAAEGRRAAHDLMLKNPTASIREIAAIAGISPSTVHDVRARMRAGLVPVSEGRVAQQPEPQTPPSVQTESRTRRSGAGRAEKSALSADESAATVSNLSRDPALRLTDAGRSLLRALSVQALLIENPSELVAAVPSHQRTSLAAVARQAGRTWQSFATSLEDAAACDKRSE